MSLSDSMLLLSSNIAKMTSEQFAVCTLMRIWAFCDWQKCLFNRHDTQRMSKGS